MKKSVPYFSLSNLKTYKFDSEEIEQMRNQLSRVDISISDRTYFHFALAQGCESAGQVVSAGPVFCLGF